MPPVRTKQAQLTMRIKACNIMKHESSFMFWVGLYILSTTLNGLVPDKRSLLHQAYYRGLSMMFGFPDFIPTGKVVEQFRTFNQFLCVTFHVLPGVFKWRFALCNLAESIGIQLPF